MDYIGSKEKLNEWLFQRVERHFPSGGVFLDGCCGSCSVSREAAVRGHSVITNDLLSFPAFLAEGSIFQNSYLRIFAEKFIIQMNALDGVDGFFYKNYSPAGNRFYFTEENARRIDACRQFIERWSNSINNPLTTKNEKEIRSYLMYCLLEAMSRVSNTAGTHGAYLKTFKDRAIDRLIIKPMPIYPGKLIAAETGDILDLLNGQHEWKEDILYLDPPYNQRQYAPNYHLYETLVKYDHPEVEGKTGLRDYSEQKSLFCAKKKALKFTEDVLKATRASLILISYSSDGSMSLAEMEEMLCRLSTDGEVTVHVKSQRRYKADNDRNNDDSFLREYLFEMVRTKSII